MTGNSRKRNFRWALTATALSLAIITTAQAQSSKTYYDDTEVFFDQSNVASGNPNVLFILDTGNEMGVAPTGAETNPVTGRPKTRMQILKEALVDVLTQVNAAGTGVNVGLMRLSVNGSGGSAAAKGGLVVRRVQPLSTDVLKDFRFALCVSEPDGTNTRDVLKPDSDCLRSYENKANNPDYRFVFGTQDQMGSGAGASPLTEMMFEAYLYYSGSAVLWGGAVGQVGPSWPFRSEPNSITPASCGAIINDKNGVPTCSTTSAPIYQTPISSSQCQANFIIIISDGVVAEDTGDDSGNASKNIQAQPYFTPYLGPNNSVQKNNNSLCSLNYTSPAKTDLIKFTGKSVSVCPDDLAYYMDQYGVGARRATVSTYAIGFDVDGAAGADSAAANSLLNQIAVAGGGRFLTSRNKDELAKALISVVNEIVIQNASFSSPAVAVNAFNRTQNLDSLYMSVFAPQTTARWPGNVKKYKLASNGDILDADGLSAVGSNGFFRAGRRSYWTAAGTADGDDVSKGGAASRIPAQAGRTIYTNTTDGSSQLTTDTSLTSRRLSNLKTPNLSASTQKTVFGITCTTQTSSPTPPNPSCPSGDQLIDWVYGTDVTDIVPLNADGTRGNGDRAEARKDMGDPLHGRPAVVIYDGGANSPQVVGDASVYSVTNDGFLHSFDAVSGVENWAFVPFSQLKRLQNLYINSGPGRPRKSLGLDGTIRILKLDRCADGVVQTTAYNKDTNPCGGDKVYLYFGMRRGGSYYYALDITFKYSPKLLWVAGPSSDTSLDSDNRLPLIGQTWSTPAVTKAAVYGRSSDQNHDGIDDKYVLVFGGGYDSDRYDNTAATAYPASSSTDVGMGIYMVDAVTGKLLWRAGPSVSGVTDPTLIRASMTHAIPADVRPIDFSGDGFVDVIYAADLGGRVWRFDVNNSANSMANFIKGGVFADLGGATVASGRRFFAAPDISFIKSGTASWFNIAIGSGNRELPISDTVTDDKFYSLRDFNKLTPYNWSTYTALTDSLLSDVTPTPVIVNGTTTYQQGNVAPDAPGWKLSLDYFDGEKVITESRTFENTVFFSSFYPKVRTGADDTDADACTTTKGYNNLYTVNVVDAKPCTTCLTSLINKGKTMIASGLGVILKQPGIAPEPVFLFPGGDNNSRVPPVCLVGAESCGTFSSYEPKRTYWLQKGAE